MKNAKFDIAYIDLEGTDLLSSPVIDYEKFRKAFLICNMVVITNFLIAGVKQPSVQVQLEKDADDNIIFNLTNYKVVIGAEEVTVSAVTNVPAPAIADAGKVLGIGIDGVLEWKTLPESGTKLYKHTLTPSSAKSGELRKWTLNNQSAISYENSTVPVNKITVYSLSEEPITDLLGVNTTEWLITIVTYDSFRQFVASGKNSGTEGNRQFTRVTPAYQSLEFELLYIGSAQLSGFTDTVTAL